MESTETRIAIYLVNQVDMTSNNRITLAMSRKDLASYLGTSPETISRKLTEFEEAGWIRQLSHREIEVVDLDALLLIQRGWARYIQVHYLREEGVEEDEQGEWIWGGIK